MNWKQESMLDTLNHGEPNTWNVTLVTDMSYLFGGMDKFNAPIDQWNTSNVTNMMGMFHRASSFNQPITMDTSKVIDMNFMFADAASFNQPITMDTSQVTDMTHMFCDASSFNQPITMDTSQVTDMSGMFMNASSFNQPITMDWARKIIMVLIVTFGRSNQSQLHLALGALITVLYKESRKGRSVLFHVSSNSYNPSWFGSKVGRETSFVSF